LTGNISDLPQVPRERKLLLDLGWVGTSLLNVNQGSTSPNGVLMGVGPEEERK